jgi:hypothetical protein
MMSSDQTTTIPSDLPSAPTPGSTVATRRPRPLGRDLAPCAIPVTSGQDRPAFGGFGFGAVNGITTTGPEAHAAVRMHVTPAIGAFWTYDQKCPEHLATPSSPGRLRTS